MSTHYTGAIFGPRYGHLSRRGMVIAGQLDPVVAVCCHPRPEIRSLIKARTGDDSEYHVVDQKTGDKPNDIY